MIIVITSIIIIYFLISAFYLLGMVIASKHYQFKKNSNPLGNPAKQRFLIMIPAYKEDTVIINTALEALNQDYDRNNFDVLVIADSLQPATIAQINKLNVQLQQVSFERSTKVKAIRTAMKNINRRYDYLVLLDADNLVKPDFLTQLDQSLDTEKHHAVQLNRTAINSDQSLSFWDAFSEFSNNKIACEGPNALGLSSKFTGSGMVIHFNYFSYFINQMHSVGGFDKDMEIRFTERKIPIHYFNHIKVYDEKVEATGQMAKQRGRWIFAQYEYLFKNFGKAFYSLFHKNFDHFHRVAQLALPPRFLGLVGLVMISLVSILIHPVLFVGSLLSLLVYSLAYLMLLLEYAESTKVLFRQLLKIPALVFTYLLALYYLPKARKSFLHTSHGQKETPKKP